MELPTPLHRPFRRCASRRRPGFTLVELLVVIGIIALLISILLPALGTAQRAGRTVKCMSSLRQIGTAFNMYASENKGWWPAAVHRYDNPNIPLVAGTEIRWPDQLSKYLLREAVNYNELMKARKSSVLWGCPEWQKVYDANETNVTDMLRPGYGMSIYPQNPTGPAAGTITCSMGGGEKYSRYWKQSEYTKPTDRALVGDSTTHVILLADSLMPAAAQLTSTQVWYPVVSGESPTFYIEGSRHAPPQTSRKKQFNTPYTNMLFCDGHCATISVRDAWNSIHNPGEDKAGN